MEAQIIFSRYLASALKDFDPDTCIFYIMVVERGLATSTFHYQLQWLDYFRTLLIEIFMLRYR